MLREDLLARKHKFPFEDDLLKLNEQEVEVLWVKGRAFIVTPATADDIDRIAKGKGILLGTKVKRARRL